MDSITQIILGAACGEAVAGRKLGNRAMLFGAIGGTIPDLDVISSLLTDEMTALAFHRGIMHSLLFACVFPWLIGWVTHKLYTSGLYKQQTYKKIVFTLSLLLFVGVVGVACVFPIALGKPFNFTVLGVALAVMGPVTWLVWQKWLKVEADNVHYSYLGWVHLYFWSILTHPILDAFTGYGTQLFQPFSDYRVRWDTVSIVDPLYTVPFALSLLAVGLLVRTSSWRVAANWVGIVYSCAYLAYTVNHKLQVNQVFRDSLAAQKIDYQRITTGPTIFNNILWNGIVETDTCFYYAWWSFNDQSRTVPKFTHLPKNHHLASDSTLEKRDIETIKWFSDGYYNVIYDEQKKAYFLNDLRFGLSNTEQIGLENYIFTWQLMPSTTQSGLMHAKQYKEPRGDVGVMFDRLQKRKAGI
jgi:inner membrane protein